MHVCVHAHAGIQLDSCTTLDGAPGAREWCATVPMYQGFSLLLCFEWCATVPMYQGFSSDIIWDSIYDIVYM